MVAHKTPTGTREWAKHNFNVCRGCSNNCRYCYAREMALRFKQINKPEDWKSEVIIEKKMEKDWAKKEGTIMFPTTHDITEGNVIACVYVLNKMLSAGNKVLIVSKPRKEAIQQLCSALSEYKGQILFRFTIGCLSIGTQNYWEKEAPAPAERIECLEYAFRQGYQTSVSCEPMLCKIEELTDLVYNCRHFVTDAIWIGKMNQIKRRVKIVTQEDQEQVDRLKEIYSDQNIRAVYNFFQNDEKVKWKDSIKQVVGIEAPEESGLDI